MHRSTPRDGYYDGSIWTGNSKGVGCGSCTTSAAGSTGLYTTSPLVGARGSAAPCVEGMSAPAPVGIFGSGIYTKVSPTGGCPLADRKPNASQHTVVRCPPTQPQYPVSNPNPDISDTVANFGVTDYLTIGAFTGGSAAFGFYYGACHPPHPPHMHRTPQCVAYCARDPFHRQSCSRTHRGHARRPRQRRRR